MRQSLVDRLRERTNLGMPQGFSVPMPEYVVDVFVEWLDEVWVELNEAALGSTYEQLIISLRDSEE